MTTDDRQTYAADKVREYWAAIDAHPSKIRDTSEITAQDRQGVQQATHHTPGLHFDRLAAGATVRDVILMLAQQGDLLGVVLRDRTRIENELRQLRSDVDAARRIFGTPLT